MPVVVGIVLPVGAVAVSMLTAAGCRDGFGCHRITADGADVYKRQEYNLTFLSTLSLAPFDIGTDVFRFALGNAAAVSYTHLV